MFGHFGMDDGRRAATLEADTGWEMLAPARTRMRADAQAAPLAVPACTGSFSTYAAGYNLQETVEILDEEVETYK